MKIRSVLLLLAMSPSLSVAQEQSRTLTIPAGSYLLKASTLRQGDMAALLKYHYPLGLFTATPKNQAPAKDGNELKQKFASSMSEFKNNKDQVDQALKISQKQIDQNNSAPLPEKLSISGTSRSAKLSLNKCIDLNLELLKQKVKIEQELEGDQIKDGQRYLLRQKLDIVLIELESHRASGGLVCGNNIKKLQSLIVQEDLEQIKILSAIRKRTDKERAQLIDTASLAYGSHLKIKDTWKALWNRLSILAVFTDKPLPSWENLILEIKSQPASSSNYDFQNSKLATISLEIDLSVLDRDLVAGKSELRSSSEN